MFFIEVVTSIIILNLGFLITQIGPLQLKLWSISFPGLPQLRLFNCLCEEFGTGFRLGNRGIWTRVLHRSFSGICEIDVRFLNHPNWTSVAQIMVYLIPGTTIA